MSVAFIRIIVELTRSGWRPYEAEPASTVYENLKCPYYKTKGSNRPYWFVRCDVFLCVGCIKKCSLNRPSGFIMPLPIKYKECPKEPFSLTPAEMIARKSLLRIDEAAYCLNISERTVYEWIAIGKLRKTIENPVRIPVEDVAYRMNNFDD